MKNFWLGIMRAISEKYGRWTAFGCCLLFLFHANAQTEDCISDTDEWLPMREAAARNPFEKTNQFAVNFTNYAEEEWCYPLPGAKMISPYGGKRRHAGTDLKTTPGDTIRAAFPGEVVISSPYYAYGNFVYIRHANGLETAYSHNVKNLVKKGDWVQAGDPIALEGQTGRATTWHLHFETRVGGKTFDSSLIFDHENHTIRKDVFVFAKRADGTLEVVVKEK